MKQKLILFLIPIVALLALPARGEKKETPATSGSYAIFAEFARDSNKLMKGGINRRVFNVVEAQSGSDITLNKDGSITLAPGTYRLTGFSLVSMQATFAPPTMKNNTNYPGYGVVYPKELESDKAVIQHLITLGTPQTALDAVPSSFDAIYTTKSKVDICVGHQSGEDLHDEVYLSVYDVAGIKSEFHLFARIAITKM